MVSSILFISLDPHLLENSLRLYSLAFATYLHLK